MKNTMIKLAKTYRELQAEFDNKTKCVADPKIATYFRGKADAYCTAADMLEVRIKNC